MAQLHGAAAISPRISLCLATSRYISRQVAEIMALRPGDFFSEKAPQRAGTLAPAPTRTLAPPQPLALPLTPLTLSPTPIQA